MLVPLVFDETDSLYSAAGFNAFVAAVPAEGPSSATEPEVYYTDLDTFESVIGATARRAGPSYESLYSDGNRFTVSSASPPDAARLVMQEVQVFDPYECGTAIDCPYTGGGGYGGGSSGGSSSGQPYRPTSDRSATQASAATWPSVWVGDVISGEKDCGVSSGTSSPNGSSASSGCSSGTSSGGSFGGWSNLGHSLIITRLGGVNVASNGRWGGDYLNDETKSMEAIGTDYSRNDQVLERKAKTWFDTSGLRKALVLYHDQATWSEREQAVAIAKDQDPDPYDFWSLKTNDTEWYCSKLIWFAYRRATGDSLDPTWGFWVSPNDLEHSGHLTTVYHYEKR